MPLLADAVRRPRFEEKDFARVKRLTLDEIAQSDDEARVVADRVAARALFGPLGPRPVQGFGEPRARLAQLAVDVGGDVVHPRGEDRGHDAQLGAVGGPPQQLGAQLGPGQGAVRDHEHAPATMAREAIALGGGLAQRAAAVGVRGAELPDEGTGDRAGEQRDARERDRQCAEHDRRADHRGAAEDDVERIGF